MSSSEEIAGRSDAEIAAALYRVLVRQMAFDPTYALVAGSLEDLRTTVRTALPDLDPETVEAREEPEVLRALMQDLASRPDVAHLVEGCFDRSRGTILREVTPSLVLAALALTTWTELSCNYAEPAKRAGLTVAIRPSGEPAAAVPRTLAALG